MTVAKINNTKVNINFTVIILCALWLFAGKLDVFIIMTAVVLIHELFHAFVASLFSMNTESIEIFPFGGAAEIRGIEDNYVYEAIVASAGPFISLLSGFLWEKSGVLSILPQSEMFVSFSYNVAMINLLPIYPLDGGRILTCIFKGLFGEKKGRKRAVYLGIVISVIIFIKSVYDIVIYNNSEGIIMSLFMLTASIKAIKKPASISLREKFWKNEQVKIIKQYDDKKILDVLNNFNGNCFYCVLVVDEEEKFRAFLTEKQIFEGAIKNSTSTLGDLCKTFKHIYK